MSRTILVAKSGSLALLVSALVALTPQHAGAFFSPDVDYQVPIKKSCKGGSLCGFLSIYRERFGSEHRVQVVLTHDRCLPGISRRVETRLVRQVDDRFSVTVDRPNFKLKVRARFIDEDGYMSLAKGVYSFRNLNRHCGVSRTGFRRERWTPPSPSQPVP